MSKNGPIPEKDLKFIIERDRLYVGEGTEEIPYRVPTLKQLKILQLALDKTEFKVIAKSIVESENKILNDTTLNDRAKKDLQQIINVQKAILAELEKK